MNKLLQPGRIMFAIGIIGLGVLCIISKDFIVGRPPAWPAGWNVNPILAYVSGTALILAAIAIIINKKAGPAALLIAALIFFLSVLRHIPHFMNDWGNGYKSLALFGGALILAVVRPNAALVRLETNQGSVKTNLGKIIVLTGCILLAAFFIASGYAHFKFAGFVKLFIPSYIPFHGFWTYFCAICLFAGAAGLLIPQTRKWAALFSGFMVLGWFLLLHIPRFIANTNDPSDRMGLCESFTFAGIFFALAGMLSEKK